MMTLIRMTFDIGNLNNLVMKELNCFYNKSYQKDNVFISPINCKSQQIIKSALVITLLCPNNLF